MFIAGGFSTCKVWCDTDMSRNQFSSGNLFISTAKIINRIPGGIPGIPEIVKSVCADLLFFLVNEIIPADDIIALSNNP